MVSLQSNKKGGMHEREAKEETGGHDDHDSCGYIDRSVTGILKAAAPAKGGVAGEVLMILA